MSNISRHPDCKHRNEIGNCLIVGGFCTAVPTSVCEAERHKGEVIRAICDNGYDGILIPGFSLLIRYNGKEVLHTYSPKLKTYDELMEVLETMPQFMDMLRKQENDLKQVTRVNVEDILKILKRSKSMSDECKKCKYKQLCKECPLDFSCEDVKRLAQVDKEQEHEHID